MAGKKETSIDFKTGEAWDQRRKGVQE